jgi:flavodoxin
MKTLVVFESMFGNSEKVARAVAAGLAERGEVEIRDVADVTAVDLPTDVDLVVLGGPTHAFSMTRPTTREDAIRQGARQGLAGRGLREWIDTFGDELRDQQVATFDTRVTRVRRLPGSAARSAARALRRRGAHQVGVPESFFVNDVSGPLDEGELDRARAWGGHLLALLVRDGSVRAS